MTKPLWPGQVCMGSGLRPGRALCRRHLGRAGGGAPGASGSGSSWGWGSSSGPAPASRWRCVSAAPPLPHGPVPATARPPRRLLWHLLGVRLPYLLHLDGGLPAAGHCGNGGSRRYPAGRPGRLGRGAAEGRRSQPLRAAAGAVLPGGGSVVYPDEASSSAGRVPGHCPGLWDLMPSERGAT